MKELSETLLEMCGTDVTVRGEGEGTIEFKLRGLLCYTCDGAFLLSMDNPTGELGLNQLRFMASDVKSAKGGLIQIEIN